MGQLHKKSTQVIKLLDRFQMLLPESLYLLRNLRRNFYASFSLGPHHFWDGLDQFVGLEDLVGRRFNDGLPVHLHIVNLAPLAGPVLIQERL